ncbi:TPA: TonB-dependent receptor [Proteus mirabilis]|uniref:TonB-dependent receptor n=4 Tax=Enterobacterales TaxID=91347 RepID=A0A2X2BDB0_PROMI|nr:TonB-dependent receptor [Proteus mirabilis]AUU38895.1 TonB-dependent receptor [Proteus mirabilis]EHZ8015560.1 TonB-dependent receptor [Proteus mirabilis]EJD6084429.1 TonB-dependent receptor [Proteus mirabilis]EKU0925873.1 TonB-dependent receptor [Proteus mirabilis]EKV2710697.1 TonB-dependent receptor [Proteus mirabilis]
MKTQLTRKILGSCILFSGIHSLVFAAETEKTVQFSSLKVSSAQKQTPEQKALAKPGAYSAIGEINNLSSVEQALRSTPGTYTQMDASQPGVGVNIRGLSGFGRVNMMIDGVTQTMYSTSPSQYAHGGQPYNQFNSMIDPNFIVQIDISRGQQDGENSINALAGSANFKTIGIDDVLFSNHRWGIRSKAARGTNGLGYNGMVAIAGKQPIFNHDGYIGAMFAISGHNIESSYKNGAGFNSHEFATTKDFNQKPHSELAKISFKPNDSHEIELSGRFYNNKFNRRTIESQDYYAKYRYTPLNDLFDSEILLSRSQASQKFAGDSLMSLRNGHAKNISNALVAKNTSRFNYHELDMALTLGTKLMSIDYNREVTAPSSDPWQSQNMIEYNVFAPQGKNDISSLFSQMKFEYDIYTLALNLNYTDYHIKGYKPACDPKAACFPEGAMNVNRHEKAWEPGALFSAQIIPEFEPFISYAHTTRAPNPQEIFFANEGGASMNPFLRSEKADTFQIGFNSYRPDLIVAGDSFRLKALWYHTKVKNYISSDSYFVCKGGKRCKNDGTLTTDDYGDMEYDGNIYLYTNSLDPVTMRGYELQVNYDADVFYTTLSYSNERTSQPTSIAMGDFGQSPASELPKYYATIDAGVRLFDDRSLELGTTIQITGKSRKASPEGLDYDTGAIPMVEQEKIPTVINAYANYQMNKNVSLKFAIHNLMNKNYSNALDRSNSAPDMYEQGQNKQTARGRSFLFGGEIRF